MEITNLADGAEEFTSNVWFVDDVLVDAGEGATVRDRAVERDVDTVVITHSHHDHVENLPAIVDEHGPDVYAFDPGNLEVDAEPLSDGDTLDMAGATFDIIHTPGHAPDHICLHGPATGVLFSGDLIFPGGAFGRTDFPNADRDDLIASIERIAGRDVSAMYAGHGEATAEHVDEQIATSLADAKEREPKYPDG